jgi:N-acetyl sugar amidotransferase
MDTTNPDLKLDNEGVCSRCREIEEHIILEWNYGKGHEAELQQMLDSIKAAGKGRKYDCLIGLSGGYDSSYLLHVAVKEWGLRPLVLHVNSGWDLPVATSNIKKIVDKLGVDFYEEKINWEQERDFQLALFKSGISSLDMPQDVAFISIVEQYTRKYDIPCILNGGNKSTEIMTNPKAWLYGTQDRVFIKDILKKYGTVSMKGYPFLKPYSQKILDKLLRRSVAAYHPLDLIPYTKAESTAILVNEYGWEPYKQKHFESMMTKFLEGYWCPKRFNADIRKCQLSSLVVTGQMTRDEALEQLSHPSLTEEEGRELFKQVAAKLEISEEELQSYFDLPIKGYDDYKNSRKWIKFVKNIKNRFSSPAVIND